MTGGIYIHIPFCRKKCDYCGFYSVAGMLDADGRIPAAYLDRLHDEITERLPAAGIPSADTVYFGGGTPSLCSAADIAGILHRVRERVDLLTGAEVTLEMNPGDVSPDHLAGLRDAGVTRVVLGVQTLSERLHALIGRSATTLHPPGAGDLFLRERPAPLRRPDRRHPVAISGRAPP